MTMLDVAILGAGAAGLFCAGQLAGRGLRVAVIDHARAPGEKIRISGGGRCNFTNLATAPDRFLSGNPRFAASALAAYTPHDFVAMVDAAGIAWHEKTAGQLFCDGKATQIVDMLRRAMGPAELRLNTAIHAVERTGGGFTLRTGADDLGARQVVVATGGKSIPAMGATGLAYDIARAHGVRVTDTRAGLVPFMLGEPELATARALSGVAVAAEARRGRTAFRDGMLFTHRGLSGPAILQISSYWQPGDAITLDLLPGGDPAQMLRDQRQKAGRMTVATALAGLLPDRLAQAIVAETGLAQARLADQPNATLDRLAARLSRWTIRPMGTEGYRTAEVTVGGVDTRDLDARSLQARAVPGLYFIGECVDVTGWLGGYNFQWAWASAAACARHISA